MTAVVFLRHQFGFFASGGRGWPEDRRADTENVRTHAAIGRYLGRENGSNSEFVRTKSN
jgi:hypothetical protein